MLDVYNAITINAKDLEALSKWCFMKDRKPLDVIAHCISNKNYLEAIVRWYDAYSNELACFDRVLEIEEDIFA